MANNIPEIDYLGTQWARVREKLLSDLESLRETNDRKMSLEDTNYIRGQINMVRQILQWEEIAATRRNRSVA